jgi:GNAT superfamily N-acetyltransferase
MHVSKRLAVTEDIDFARQIHHRAYRDVLERQYGPWDEAAQDSFFVAAWSAAAHELILCDGVPCGYLCVEDRENDIHVRELVMDPEFQSRGVGTVILIEICERARVRMVPVRLRTQLVNRAANLYRRQGFRELERTDSHILMEWTTD